MVMGKRRSATDCRGATNHHKSESPASQQAGSTNLDTLSPVELQVIQGIRRGRHPVDAAQGWMLPAVVRDAMGPAVLPPPGPGPGPGRRCSLFRVEGHLADVFWGSPELGVDRREVGDGWLAPGQSASVVAAFGALTAEHWPGPFTVRMPAPRPPSSGRVVPRRPRRPRASAGSQGGRSTVGRQRAPVQAARGRSGRDAGRVQALGVLRAGGAPFGGLCGDSGGSTPCCRNQSTAARAESAAPT